MPADCPLPAGSTVAGYGRDSGGRDQDRSVLQQRAEIEAYCRDRGLALVRWFADEARPGSSVIGRDAFLEMIAWLRRLAPEPERRRSRRGDGRDPDAPDGVLFWSLARSAREQDDRAYFWADLRRRGYTVFSVTDGIPGGDLAPVVESLFAWQAEQYLQQLSREVTRGMRDMVTRRGPDGEYLNCWNNHPPPGFRAEPRTIGARRDGRPHVVRCLVPDRDGLWEPVRRAFALRAAGLSVRQIEAELGLGWSRQRYGHLFRNPIYAGRLEYGDLVIDGWIEPAVDPATWAAVQDICRNHDAFQRRARSRPRSAYPLSGLLRCPVDGAAMTGSSCRGPVPGAPPYRYYRCSHYGDGGACAHSRGLRADYLEPAVYGALARDVLTPEALRAALEGGGPAELNGARAELAAAEKRVADLERATGRLLEAIEGLGGEGQPVAVLAERLAARQAERLEAEAELRAARARLSGGCEPVPPEVLADFCRDAARVLEEGEPGAVRDLLEVIVVRIVARTDGTGEIHYRPLGELPGRAPAAVAPFHWFPGGRGFKRPAV